MKIRKYLYGLLAAGITLAACEKTDEKYMDFASGGEITYPGKADSLKSNPGNGRTELVWLLINDTRIVKCKVFWNRGADSSELVVKRTTGVDTVKLMLTLPEGPYLFDVYTYDAQGNKSIKAQLNADIYGDFYQSNLVNRTLISATIVDGNARLTWEDADPRSTGVELSYTDENGDPQQIVIPSSEKITNITGRPQTGSISYQTLYLPVPNAIDVFKAAAENVNL